MANTKPHASQIRYGSGNNTVDKTLKQSVLSFQNYAEASAAAATLPDGQEVKSPDADGRVSFFEVQSGNLVFQYYTDTAVNLNQYVVGDGVADDTAGLLTAISISAGRTLDLGDFQCRVTTPLSITVSGTWIANGARILYDGPVNQNIGVNMTLDGTGLTVQGRLIIDGNSKCAKPLYVGNNSDTLRSFEAPNIVCRNGRKTTSDWGAALLAEGNFEVFDISGGLFENVTMAAGAKDTPGVAGAVVKASSSTRYPRRVYLNDATAKNIFAEGMDYQGDQDGFRVFGPDGAADTHPHKMELFAHNISGIDCAGRVIKTQCDYAEINGVYIERNMTSVVAAWGIDIDVQTGGGFVRGVQAIYRSNVPVTTVLINSTIAGYTDVPSAQVDGVQIINRTATELREVLLLGSRDTTKPPQVFASGFRVIGPLTSFVRSSPLTNTNGLNISVDGMIGAPSLGAFVTDASSSTGRVFGRAVVNLGSPTVPFWRRAGAGQVYEVSSIDCHGWLDDRRLVLATNNPAPTRLGRVAPATGTRTGSEILLSKELVDGEIWTLPAHGWNNDGLYLIKVGFTHTDFAILSAGTTGIVTVAAGSSFQVGSTTEPTTGNYRVWTSATGLFIANRSGSTRMVTVKAIG